MSTEPNNKDIGITTKTETSEVLDTNGKNIPKSGALSDIFDKIESGTPAKEAVTEVMSKDKPEDKSTEVAVAPAKEEESKAEPAKTEVKENASNIEDQFKEDQAKKDAKPEEVKKADEDVPEEELAVLPHDKPKTAKRIQALLNKVGSITSEVVKTKAEAADKATRLAEAEKKLSEVKSIDPATEEKIKAQLDELSMFRRKYELEKDPAVKSKYDDRIASVEKDIPEILKKNAASEGLIKLIEEEGGWSRFSRSNRQITMAGGKVVTSAELADNIVSALPFADRSKVQSITMEQITLQREKERFLADEQKTANEYFKKRDEDAGKSSAEYQKQVSEAQETINKWHAEVTSKNEFLKEKDIPATATAEQKAAITEDNEFTKQLNGVLKKNLGTKDMKGMLEVVFESVQYHQQRRENARMLAKLTKAEADLKAKQEELDKFKTSGRSVPKSGSIAAGGVGTIPKEKKPASLEEAFNLIESAS